MCCSWSTNERMKGKKVFVMESRKRKKFGEKIEQKLDERFAVDEITLQKKEFVLDSSSCIYLHLETLQEQIRFVNLI